MTAPIICFLHSEVLLLEKYLLVIDRYLVRLGQLAGKPHNAVFTEEFQRESIGQMAPLPSVLFLDFFVLPYDRAWGR